MNNRGGSFIAVLAEDSFGRDVGHHAFVRASSGGSWQKFETDSNTFPRRVVQTMSVPVVPPISPRVKATAYHEAGHAVVALALGRAVQRVSILPGRAWLGRCEFQKGRVRPSEDWLEREILISLAGAAAEARHTGVYAWEGAITDLRTVRRLAVQRASERQAARLERRLLAKVEHLLDQSGYWRAVELIVVELLRCETISGRAVRHLFDQGNRQTDPSAQT